MNKIDPRGLGYKWVNGELVWDDKSHYFPTDDDIDLAKSQQLWFERWFGVGAGTNKVNELVLAQRAAEFRSGGMSLYTQVNLAYTDALIRGSAEGVYSQANAMSLGTLNTSVVILESGVLGNEGSSKKPIGEIENDLTANAKGQVLMTAFAAAGNLANSGQTGIRVADNKYFPTLPSPSNAMVDMGNLGKKQRVVALAEVDMLQIRNEVQAVAPKNTIWFPNHPQTVFSELRSGTQQVREMSGMVRGGETLPDITGQWINDGAGAMPGQIARQMHGRIFRNFKEFRQVFWKLVEEDSVLGPQFSTSNRAAMRNGNAPVAPGRYQIGEGSANIKFNLDHIDSLEEQFSIQQARQLLYDLDNIQIVGPKWNQAR